MSQNVTSKYSLAARAAAASAGAAAALALCCVVAGAQDLAGQDSAAQGNAAPVNLEFTPAEKAWLAAHPVIRVGAETNYAPYEFQDSRGHFSGMVADYMEVLKRRLGVRFQVQQMPDFAAVENKLRKREVDVVLALAPTAEREEFLRFTKPYLHYVNVIVTRTTSVSSRACEIWRWSALASSPGIRRSS